MQFLERLFDTSGFPARWNCGTWSEALGWTTIGSDVAIWGAYTAIPCVLAYFVLRRTDVPFPRVFWLFVAFILACGATHLVEAIIFWEPVYRLSAAVKLGTAVVSWLTVFALLRIIPKALHLPSVMRVNEELRRSQAAAEAANEAKSRFLAHVSHEIRTPMSAILGFAELLADGGGDPKDRERARTIQRNGNHLLQIVDDLLDLSRIEAGRLEIQPERFSPGALIEDVRLLMSGPAEEKGLRLGARCEGSLPATIDTDPTRLRQILVNLVGNALKFTERGEVELVARCVHGGRRPSFEVDVRDTGQGLSADEQRRLFEPFYRGDSNGHGKAGTGLGLAISRQLARLLGGDLTVESEPGRGSTFTARVDPGPLDGVPFLPPEEALKAAPEEVLPLQLARISGRLLLAEDSPSLQKLLTFCLENAGADVLCVGNGEEAIAAALSAEDEGRPFDLVLMDMHMPQLDGYAATERLRSKGFRRPIVALTAGAMPRDRERCITAGCDDFASKPIDARHLVELIARHLGRSSDGELAERGAEGRGSS